MGLEALRQWFSTLAVYYNHPEHLKVWMPGIYPQRFNLIDLCAVWAWAHNIVQSKGPKAISVMMMIFRLQYETRPHELPNDTALKLSTCP